ncbi:MAG: hypothetical protein K0Q78_1536 [Cellvibrio sp.]|nr:hypothetical protein [Cellvibrio sp.]
MTFSFVSPRRLLGAVCLALACAFPVAHAAELEGTPVPVDGAPPVQAQPEAPPPVAPEHPDAVAPEAAPPPSSPDDHERWMKDNENLMRHNERQMRDHQNWQQDLEKNLNQAFGGDHDGDDGFHPALLIPIFAVLFIFGGPVILLILILVFFFGAKRRRQQDINMNIDKLLAAGRDIPVELLRGDEPRSADDTGNLAKGIRNICLGAGWLVFLTIAWDIEVGAVGFIWIGLGLSQVLIWYLNKPAGTEQAGQQD